MKYITKDRAVSILTAAFVSAVLFSSPWGWLTTATISFLWVGSGFLLVVFGQGISLLFEDSERTVAYVANIYYNSRYLKRKDLIGQFLDQVPPAVTVGVLLWNSYMLLGSVAFALWLLSNFVVEFSVRLFGQLDDSDQKALIEAMKEQTA